MNAIPTNREFMVREDELRDFVAAAFAKQRSHRVTGIERRRCDDFSSFAIEELTVRFDDGSAIELIFKNLAHDELSSSGRAMRPASTFRPDREGFVYLNILAAAALGTATCHDAVTDSRLRRYWLLLEKVPGDQLFRIGDFTAWRRAARWLAKAHVRLLPASEMHQNAPELARYDSQSLNQWIDQAEIVCNALPTGGESNRRAHLAWLVEQARLAVDLVCRLPTTFIHGEFYPSNVLIDLDSQPPRTCPVDWETAGIGSGLFDLAALVAGNWSEQQKNRLAHAYFSALEPSRLTAGMAEPMTALRCCGLIMAMKWIGRSTFWQPPPEHRYDWFAAAQQLAHAISDDRRGFAKVDLPATRH